MEKKYGVDPELTTTRDPLKFDNMQPLKVIDGDGDVEIEVLVTEDMMNPNGIMHGGMTFTFADICAGIGAHALGYKASTMQSSVNFVRPANSGDKLRAKNNVIHEGRTTIVSRADVYDQENRLILSGVFTMAKLGPRE